MGLRRDVYGAVISGMEASGGEWRNREPWEGVFDSLAEYDGKGRTEGAPVFRQGRFVGYGPSPVKRVSPRRRYIWG